MSRPKNPRAASALFAAAAACFLLVTALNWDGRPLIVGMNALTGVLLGVAAVTNGLRARHGAS